MRVTLTEQTLWQQLGMNAVGHACLVHVAWHASHSWACLSTCMCTSMHASWACLSTCMWHAHTCIPQLGMSTCMWHAHTCIPQLGMPVYACGMHMHPTCLSACMCIHSSWACMVWYVGCMHACSHACIPQLGMYACIMHMHASHGWACICHIQQSGMHALWTSGDGEKPKIQHCMICFATTKKYKYNYRWSTIFKQRRRCFEKGPPQSTASDHIRHSQPSHWIGSKKFEIWSNQSLCLRPQRFRVFFR